MSSSNRVPRSRFTSELSRIALRTSCTVVVTALRFPSRSEAREAARREITPEASRPYWHPRTSHMASGRVAPVTWHHLRRAKAESRWLTKACAHVGTLVHMSEAPVRVRFAPSPTGMFHVGGARSALYNWAV